MGDSMYLNFSNMRILADNLDENIRALNSAKEKIEYQYQRLAQNTELDAVIVQMKKTAEKIDDGILKAQKLKIALIRTMEIYDSGERRIKEHVEGSQPPLKAGQMIELNLLKSSYGRVIQ